MYDKLPWHLGVLLALFLYSFSAQAEITPSLLFSDHMVIQRDAEVPVWGWAEKKEKITVEFNGQTVQTKADKSGKWMLKLAPVAAGGPYKLIIKGNKSDAITIEDVLVGEVWVCSGQSNMEWILRNTNDADNEIATASDKMIRHFKVPKMIGTSVKDKLHGGEWQVTSPETVGDFTAVGYFFAKNLRKELNVPIGLLNTSWGGTVVETWISAGAISTVPTYSKTVSTLGELNLEEANKKKIAELKERLGDFPETDPGLKDGKPLWAANDLAENDWETMDLPEVWDLKELPGLDGIVWFRKTITLSESEAASDFKLHLAKVDDSDITYVNGQEVGKMNGQYSTPRVYNVSADILKPGKNVITVRVEDTGGGGGIYGLAENMKMVSANKLIDLSGAWKYKIGAGKISTNQSPNDYPTLLYNAMVNPIIPYAMKGVIWYQGESNAGRAYEYRTLFPMLINDWRAKWGAGDFPFLWVQLANYMQPNSQPAESNWAELREAQSMTLSLPNTGEAVIIDIGEANDIHPRNKQDVGLRLALAAEKVAYGKDVVYSGPEFKEMATNGKEVTITFDHVGSGLTVKDKYGYVNGFAVAGADKKFHWAKAKLEGNKVILFSDEVKNPEAVRYGWADNPDDLNLYNKEGLPAKPFRTDEWPGLTQPK
ncbi:sialate O-acetylesterase [Chondrinema litorale]|uniref:sialate O-acetylesterase n=1 Tax=Chondrinema litorale TaxID=2994555 RepID=UPI00254294FA|nr:sialate O-acetylesterase [Chondrinema litorale]UZR94870.1 beta galactosidase jelly roll domain-containing protein [Chondrinema litorale]